MINKKDYCSPLLGAAFNMHKSFLYVKDSL